MVMVLGLLVSGCAGDIASKGRQAETARNMEPLGKWEMADKYDLDDWVTNVLKALGGSGIAVEVSKHIWERHKLNFERPEICFILGNVTFVGRRISYGVRA